MGSNPAIPTKTSLRLQVNGMDFTEVVRRRRMVRAYADRPVAPDQLDRILSAAQKPPSAGFSQGQSLVVVTDPDLRRQTVEAMRGRPINPARAPWPLAAGVLVVCCTSEKVYRDRYSEPDKLVGGKPIVWPVPYWYIDAGFQAMLLLLAAVEEGLGACFFGTSAEGYDQVKKLLGIPEHVTPVGFVTIGYPAPDTPSPSLARGWKRESEVVHREKWGRTP